MAQFDVCQNRDANSRNATPYLLVVQSDLIAQLHTRAVVPLKPLAQQQDKTMKILTPLFDIQGETHVMVTPEIAGVSERILGDRVISLAARREEIMAALDLLLLGF